ncbi:choice-of-anchor D domain-containing protein [Jiulongibacter sp. NS-SX5]|uniref:choice-of-anchor D domain-containing protein n=1 Tax=Jiulongibacter sp. NS-SX5 TaxID=3463854 RepID=UPI004058FDD5
MKRFSLLLLIIFSTFLAGLHAQQLNATFSVASGNRLQMVLHEDAYFEFSQSYHFTDPNPALAVVIKNVYSSAKLNSHGTATGPGYTTTGGQSGSVTAFGTYGSSYGQFDVNTDEVIVFEAANAIANGAVLTIPAGTYIHDVNSYNSGNSGVFNAGPYTAIIPDEPFTGVAATMIAPPTFSLSPGDIAFVGYNTDSPDGYSFVTLTDIPAGEVIYFTDQGWHEDDSWYPSTETHLKWTAPAGGLSAGSIVSIIETSPDVLQITGGGTLGPLVTTDGFTPSSFNLLGGDGILAYQGAIGTANPSFIAGLYGDDNYAHTSGCDNSTTKWFTNTIAGCNPSGAPAGQSTSTSTLPSDLTNGIDAVMLNPDPITEVDNYKYNGIFSGSQSQLLATINDYTNWIRDDGTNQDITPSDYNGGSGFTIGGNPPTASSFPSTAYENLTFTFSTSDFGYTDGDSDPLDHVLIESIPAAGTLYLDADNDDLFDGGETVSINDQISKADLDAGNLQYIQNGSTNTSFQFEVNDGSANSSGDYIATVNVQPVPTVTLSITPESKSESITTSTAVTATLSNAYGAATTVNLSFSGTAIGSGVDYSRSGTNILILSGNTSNSISLTNVPDALYEGNESIEIDITSVSNGTESGTQQVTYTIIDDDSPPNATLEVLGNYNPITDESGGQAYIRGKIDVVAGTTVFIPLSFSGTATGGGTDYSITGNTITLSPGETMDSIRVTSQYDGIPEGDETVIIDMGTPTNAVESGTQQVTVVIKDEDGGYPEINLKGNGQNIADGDITPSTSDSTHFGYVNFTAGSNTNTFTIENTGAGTLQLTGTPKVTISGTDASSFTVVTQPAASIASSGSSEFQISFDPDSQGIKEAVVTISSNDADEGDFGFRISGIGLELKELGFCQDFETFTNCATTSDCEAVVCDLIEGWTNDNSDQIDWRVNSGPTPSETTGPETDYSEGTSSGKYLYLEASGCLAGPSGSLLSPIIDLSDALSPQLSFAYYMYGAFVDSLAIDISSDGGLSFVNDFWTKYGDQGNSWFTEEISLSSFIGDSIVVRFRGKTGIAFRSDIALDYICFNEASPLAIYGNNILIPDGDLTPSLTDSTDFGTINIYNGNNTNNFYIKNLTSQDLTVGSLFINGTNASDFISTQPSSSVISANDSVLFQIRFETTNPGPKTALVNIPYSGENYSFQIQGTGSATCTQVATSTELMTWSGSADTDWDNACNWSPNGVPTATNDVSIPSAPGNPPTIVVNSAVAKSVEVQSGATLTIASSGELTVNNFKDFGGGNSTAFYNKGTVENYGKLILGSTSSTGNYGLYNEGSFNNNTNAQISIDRSTEAGLRNLSGTFDNAAEIKIGSNSSTGNYGLFNRAVFQNNAGGMIYIDRSSNIGFWNNSNTFTNVSEIRIGSIAGVGSTGLYNEATFNNNTNGAIYIDRSTNNGLLNSAGGAFSNISNLIIGSNAAVGANGLRNEAGFNNNASGLLQIDGTTGVGLQNISGTFTNISEIRIGSISSVGNIGLSNDAVFNNNAGGVINIDGSTGDGLRNNAGTFTNVSEIKIGSNSSVGSSGLYNLATFQNNANSLISIDRSLSIGLYNNSGTFSNYSEIKIGSNASVGGTGLYNEGSFTNSIDGVISIDSSNSYGLRNYIGGSFDNYSEIRIGSNASVGSDGLVNEATFNNNNCGKVLVEQGRLVVTAGNTYTNAGYTIVLNGPLDNNGAFINNGVLKYLSTSDNAIVNTTNSSVIVNDNPTPIFTYGGTYNGTINGIFKSDSVTSAGTFVGPNTFTPNGSLSSGSQTLLAKITPNGGGCTYFVPFTYVNCTNSATISYAGTPYCSSASTAAVTLTGTAGGTFTSAPAGLSINSTTGQIAPSGSTPDTYTVTYTIAASGGCPIVTTTTSVTISPLDDAGFSYASSSYCTSVSDPSPTITGLAGGTFSSTAGLSINSSTGQIDVSASTPGTYTVTYTTSGSCSNSSTQSVTINALDNAGFSYASPSYCTSVSDPTPTITGLAGGTFSSTAGLSINSSTGQIDVSASTPGTYTVTYTTSGSCSNYSTENLTISALPTVNISGTDNLTCTVTSVTRTASGGASYSWSGPGTFSASTDVVFLTTPGTYTVTVTGFNSCTATETTTVTLDNATPAPSISGTNNLTCAVTSVTRTASGGNSYSWSGPSAYSASTAQATITAAGTYTVTVTATNGCTATATTVVTLDGTPPSPSISGTNNLTCAVTSVTRTASGGTSYSWSGPSAYSASTAQATITAAGTYTVTVTGTNGCTATATTVVTLDGTPPTPLISGTDNLTCAVTSVIRTASGGISYSWSGPSAYSASTAQATITAAGTYTVTVTGTNGCTATATTVVTLDGTPPTPSISGTNNLTCAVTSVTRTASGGTSYSWSGPSAYSASTAQATITAAGTYTVTVTGTNGCTATATTVITLDGTPPTPSISGTNNLTCAVTSVTRTASGGTSYSWSGPSAYSASTAQATITAAGTYTVTVTATNGCTATATTVVTLDGTPPTPSISGTDNLTCAVTSVTRTASGGTSYSWSGPSAYSASTAQATITVSGTYTVTVTGTNGCTATATTVVTLDGTPPTPSISGTDNLTCAVTSVTRTASGGTSYSWSGPSAFSASTAQATITAAGTYTVTVTGTNGCTATATTVVTLDGTPPTPSISGTNNLTCAVTSVTRTASGGTSYSWSGPSAYSVSTAQATITAAGTYTVTVTATNGCTATATTVVTLDGTAPTPSISGTDNLTCAVTSVTRTASGGNSYSWSGPSAFSASTAQATITAAGTYTVTVAGTNGCTATASTVVTLDGTPPTPSITGSDNLTCSVTSVTRTASGGNSYSWSGPSGYSASTAQATITAAGTYTVTLTGTNGCTATATTVVTLESTPPTPSISGTNNLTCAVTSVTRTASGGNSYSWSGPSAYSASTAQATITAAGTYTVTVTATNGCTATATTVVSVDDTEQTLGVTSYVRPSACGLNDATISFSTSMPDGTFSFAFTQNSISTTTSVTVNSGSFTLNNLQPGTYTQFALNSEYCTANSTALIEIVPIPLNVTASNTGPYIEGDNIQLTGTGGPTYNWTGPNGFNSTLQNPTITNSSISDAGIYTLTVINGACTATATTEVSVENANPAFSFYYAYGGVHPEIIAPLTQNAEFQISDKAVTILAVPNINVQSTRLQLSGTTDLQFFKDNEAPYSLYEANNIATGDYLKPNFHTFIARGYDQPNNQGNVLIGPDVIGFWIIEGDRSIALQEPASTTLCAQASFNIDFSSSGTFDAGNSFIAYLSDENGHFTNPYQIGQGNGTTITCTLPNDLKSGTGYKVKIVSTSPIVTSEISITNYNIIGLDTHLTSPNDDLINQTQHIKAVQSIKASNVISNNSEVDLQAGNNILLSPGFKVDGGSVFQAKIENSCP